MFGFLKNLTIRNSFAVPNSKKLKKQCDKINKIRESYLDYCDAIVGDANRFMESVKAAHDNMIDTMMMSKTVAEEFGDVFDKYSDCIDRKGRILDDIDLDMFDDEDDEEDEDDELDDIDITFVGEERSTNDDESETEDSDNEQTIASDEIETDDAQDENIVEDDTDEEDEDDEYNEEDNIYKDVKDLPMRNFGPDVAKVIRCITHNMCGQSDFLDTTNEISDLGYTEVEMNDGLSKFDDKKIHVALNHKTTVYDDDTYSDEIYDAEISTTVNVLPKGDACIKIFNDLRLPKREDVKVQQSGNGSVASKTFVVNLGNKAEDGGERDMYVTIVTDRKTNNVTIQYILSDLVD